MTETRVQFSIDGTFHFSVDADSREEAVARAKRFLHRLHANGELERDLGAVSYPGFSPSGADTDFEPALSAFDEDGNEVATIVETAAGDGIHYDGESGGASGWVSA